MQKRATPPEGSGPKGKTKREQTKETSHFEREWKHWIGGQKNETAILRKKRVHPQGAGRTSRTMGKRPSRPQKELWVPAGGGKERRGKRPEEKKKKKKKKKKPQMPAPRKGGKILDNRSWLEARKKDARHRQQPPIQEKSTRKKKLTIREGEREKESLTNLLWIWRKDSLQQAGKEEGGGPRMGKRFKKTATWVQRNTLLPMSKQKSPPRQR